MDKAICELTIKMPRDLTSLHLATETANWICQTLYRPPLKPDIAYAVELSVSEACTNAVKHAATVASEDTLTIVFEIFKQKLSITVIDQGPGYDINNIPLPDFDQHPEGGYGIFIIRTMMDEVAYSPKDGCNNLKMIKYLEHSE
jgi:serine/threonine-protein kinase RsbW